jgi:hypothetical protein
MHIDKFSINASSTAYLRGLNTVLENWGTHGYASISNVKWSRNPSSKVKEGYLIDRYLYRASQFASHVKGNISFPDNGEKILDSSAAAISAGRHGLEIGLHLHMRKQRT